jgi:hypothetical protein
MLEVAKELIPFLAQSSPATLVALVALGGFVVVGLALVVILSVLKK